MALAFVLVSFLLAVISTAFPIAVKRAPNFVFNGDAPYSVDTSTLAAALTCPNGAPSSGSPPVLLVHGTATTGNESWGEGYVPALKKYGFTACYLTLPGRAMGDMQVSSEYVAYGLHYISQLSGGLRTAVISHSQGGPDTQWALQFWPSTHAVTSSFIALSPDMAGVELLGSDMSDVCVGDLCQASLWQQSNGSHYYNALHYKNFKAQVPTTTIWTSHDGTVNPPQANAGLPGATVVSVQDLCPFRLTDHIFMTIDAAAFSLALDALKHGGTASVSRLKSSALGTCLSVVAPGMNINLILQLEALLNDLINGFILGTPRVTAEPAVMSYAQPPPPPNVRA